MTPMVESLLAQIPEGVRDAARAIVDGLPEGQAVDVICASWSVKLDMADVARRVQHQRDAQAAGHAGGVKTARKRRMGLLPAVDPAGKTWKPVTTGPLDPAIFPKWGRVPVYVPPLVGFMNRVTLATIVLIGEVVDRTGRFSWPGRPTPRRPGARRARPTTRCGSSRTPA
jgi:hypothetical protein